MKMLRKTALLAATAGLIFGAVADDSGSNLSDLRGLELRHTKIPVLNQGKLQMVIFASSGKRKGELLAGTNTVLAIIRKGAAPDAIRDDWELVHYPLGSPLPQVLEFWKTRIAYSDGIMNTPEAEIDTLGRRAGGTREVHFRSPLDADAAMSLYRYFKAVVQL